MFLLSVYVGVDIVYDGVSVVLGVVTLLLTLRVAELSVVLW